MEATNHPIPHPGGWKRWLYTTNHKDIGTLYLFFSLIMLFIGGLFALLIRIELSKPNLVLLNPEVFNQMTTLHGLIMIFGVIMPAMTGMANWMIPLMIGAPDMALPRLNNWSFWLLPCAFILLISTFILRGPAPNFGWTFYVPLSSTYGPRSTDFLIFTIHMLGVSSILSALNIEVTIFNMRAPNMKWMKLPLFVWTWLVTGFLLLTVMPVLAGTVTMILMDRHFHTSFFSAAGGGDPILFQHLFWFFGHPEVYILILPGFGIISSIIPVFSRKALFGYRLMVFAVVVIALLALLVWMHHMFTTGALFFAQIATMYLTMLIAVPTGIKIFNWIATLYKGSISFETPMLFALGFLVMFTIGGLSGVMLSLVPSDYQYRDSYFVVGHLHYVLVAGSLFSIMAGVYYWLPKWTGQMYNEKLGQIHFWMTTLGMNLTFFPMHFLGLAGMPRRIPDYALQFTTFNQLSTTGALIFGLAQLFFLYNVLKTCFSTPKSILDNKIWDGAEGLEWTLPTPLPYHTFGIVPEVK